jgi:hypothetical protein
VLQDIGQKIGIAIDLYAAEETDTEELRLRKNILVVDSIMLTVAGTLWGIIYIIFGEPLAGGIPITYAFISLCIFVIFGLTPNFTFYQDSLLLLILMIPFRMIMLGGFLNSSAVIILSLICPLGVLLLVNCQRSVRMLVAYLALLTTRGFLQP